jgi:hypothetical protein
MVSKFSKWLLLKSFVMGLWWFANFVSEYCLKALWWVSDGFDNFGVVYEVFFLLSAVSLIFCSCLRFFFSSAIELILTEFCGVLFSSLSSHCFSGVFSSAISLIAFYFRLRMRRWLCFLLCHLIVCLEFSPLQSHWYSVCIETRMRRYLGDLGEKTQAQEASHLTSPLFAFFLNKVYSSDFFLNIIVYCSRFLLEHHGLLL